MSNSNYLAGRTKSFKCIGEPQRAAGLVIMSFHVYFEHHFIVSVRIKPYCNPVYDEIYLKKILSLAIFNVFTTIKFFEKAKAGRTEGAIGPHAARGPPL